MSLLAILEANDELATANEPLILVPNDVEKSLASILPLTLKLPLKS